MTENGENNGKKARMEDDPFRWPGYTGEAYPEMCDIRAMPPQPKDSELKPGQLPEKLIKQYFEEGYLIIKDFFTKEELQACRDDLEDEVDRLANKLYKAGKIKNLYEEYDLDHRLIKIDEEWPGAVILLHKIGRLPPSFRELWGNKRLLNLIEQLIGPDIAGMPNWNLRDKTPHNEATTVPWHQDAGYLSTDIYKVFMPTVWIPFVNTNKQNGCMEVVPKGHLSGKVAVHQCCAGDTWYIMLEEDEMKKRLGCSTKDAVVCEIPYGGFLLFNNFIPHRSLDNKSDHIRWSVDLRFKVPGENNGMFGLKPDVIMRTKENPNMEIDWETFDSLNRTELQIKSVKDIVDIKADQEFDATVQGPWMRKWEITHINTHVKKHQQQEKAKGK